VCFCRDLAIGVESGVQSGNGSLAALPVACAPSAAGGTTGDAVRGDDARHVDNMLPTPRTMEVRCCLVLARLLMCVNPHGLDWRMRVQVDSADLIDQGAENADAQKGKTQVRYGPWCVCTLPAAKLCIGD
jgi:hypothetical protein